MPSTDAVRRARAYLLRVAEPPAVALAEFVDTHGPVRAAELVATADVPDAVREETSLRRHHDLAEQDLAAAQRVGARLVTPEDDEWPARHLAALGAHRPRETAPPLALWVRGSARVANALQTAICVVGARAATSYGEQVAAEFGYGLATDGWTVISGAAYGIDGAAYRGALAADGVAVAVLGCGVDIAYPAGHASMLDRIAQRGLIVSEYPPGAPPARHRFLTRARLLAALGAGTVVVEAGARSGARATAATAAMLGRPVMVVPGPITSPMSKGCHELLRAGAAIPVTSVDDILESIDHAAPHTAAQPEQPSA